ASACHAGTHYTADARAVATHAAARGRGHTQPTASLLARVADGLKNVDNPPSGTLPFRRGATTRSGGAPRDEEALEGSESGSTGGAGSIGADTAGTHEASSTP